MTSDKTHHPEQFASAALLNSDKDTLLNAPLVLRELRRAQGKPVSAATVFSQTISSLAQPYTPQEWYAYLLEKGQFNTAKRLQTYVEGVSPADFNQLLRQWRENVDSDVTDLRQRIKKQSPVLGESVASAEEMIQEAQQMAVEGWCDLADEHLEQIDALLRDIINSAQDERKRWFGEAQKVIGDLKARVIDHEQELFQQDTYDLVWELLNYADKISVGRGHDPDLIAQIRANVQTLFQGGLADPALLQTLRGQFQTILPAPPAGAAPTPFTFPAPGDGRQPRTRTASDLLSARERALLVGAIGPGLDVMQMNLTRATPFLIPPNKEEATRLYGDTEKAARDKLAAAKKKGLAGAHEIAQQARDVETAVRRLLRYLAPRKNVSTVEERNVRTLVVVAANLRAWSFLAQGAWESAAFYYRLSLRIQEFGSTDASLRETTLNYFAAAVLQQPLPDLPPNVLLDRSTQLPISINDALAIVLAADKARPPFEAAALALWELGKETAGLRTQVLAALDRLRDDALRAGLLQGFRQLAHPLQEPFSPDLRQLAQALIERGLALDNEREEQLLQLQEKSLSAQTLAEADKLIAALSAQPLWGSADTQVLTSLQAITAAMGPYFDPQLTFSDRDPFAREIQRQADDAETLINRQPTRWGERYLGHVVANLRDQVDIEHAQVRQAARPRLEITVARGEWRRDGRYYCHLQFKNLGEMRADDVTFWVTESRSGEYDVAPEEPQKLGTLYPDRPVFALAPLNPKFNEAQDAFTLSLQFEYVVPDQSARESRKSQLRVDGIVSRPEPPPPSKNPFVVGSPVVDDPLLFKGRDKLIEELAAVISNPAQAGSVVLFGQKRSGKTSILFNLGNYLERASPKLVIPLRIDIAKILSGLPHVTDDAGPLMERATARLLLAFSGDIEKKCRDLNRQGEWGIRVKAMTAEEIMQEPGPGIQFSRYLRRFKENNPQYRLLLMLDEFTALMERIDESLIDGTIMRLFKALIDEHLLSFVICGLNEVLPAVDRYANQLAASLVRPVDYLSEADAAALIRDPIRLPDGGDRFYSGHEVKEIFALTAGNPFYTQVFGRRLVDYLMEQGSGRITMADVPRVVARLTEGADKLAAIDFDNLYRYKPGPDEPRDAILEGLIVHLIAHETTSKDYVQTVALYAQMKEFVAEDEFAAAVERLVRNQTIVEEFHDTARQRGEQSVRRPRNFRLRVDLFRRWLLANHPMDEIVLKEFARKLSR
jgi:hypothetical protein